MSDYSTDDIDRLMACPKRVVQPPKREMKVDRGSMRNDFQIESEDGQQRFSAFVRINEHFPENFSIGLKYHPPDGPSFNIFRCNGPHGNHVDIGADHPHFCYHVHEAEASMLSEGNLAERHASVTNKYASFEEALSFFIRTIHIMDAEEHFPALTLELPLFEPEN